MEDGLGFCKIELFQAALLNHLPEGVFHISGLGAVFKVS